MKPFLNETYESFRMAWEQIRSQRIRSFLTALGVIIGIVSITMMGTAISGIDKGFEKSLSMLGYDVVYIQKSSWTSMDDWWIYRNRPDLKTSYAETINGIVEGDGDSLIEIAVPQMSTFNASASYRDRSIEQVYAIGSTADYMRTASGDIEEGRFFMRHEELSATMVCVIGSEIAEGLFPGGGAVGKTIRLKNRNCRVIGVFRKQGKFLGLFSFDNQLLMPLDSFRRVFGSNRYVTMRIKLQEGAAIEEARDEIRGVMRRVRQLRPAKKDDFAINEQQAFKQQLDPIKNGIAVAGLFITGMSLFVGAIGIMNITFVSVKERTREIGLRKALGARRRTILMQFLIESVTICLLGGAVGLLTALGMTAAISAFLPEFPLPFSPALVVLSLGVSVLTGVISGFAPALSASRLDPADSLRYE
ncbi:ABC transporter permease [Prosthecochloris sp. CIB 2401]|uniref:ABC transporter permease n=1 Tax=Prosthecochloris sp. CIB 2401 TaxID=1868325 RepID=UPI00080AC05F|nr:ABC transporter permease [Prosthecochloris sp. CIB 2401]ANT64508.1 Macrolide export ATP-binding/permease protein MacB [Prosthecochloris sp. CIB 2401]